MLSLAALNQQLAATYSKTCYSKITVMTILFSACRFLLVCENKS